MIYLDNAATTKLHKKVIDEMNKTYDTMFFNPSSQYEPAKKTKSRIESVKDYMKKNLGLNLGEIIFTSSTTESNNLYIKSIVSKYCNNKKINIIATNIDHPSIYNQVKDYESSSDIDIKYSKLTDIGKIDKKDLINKIDDSTKLVILTHVNSETGIIEDIEDIAFEIKKKNPDIKIFVDGAQAVGKINVNLPKQIDGYSFSSHKIHGPKGVSALYVKDIKDLTTILKGGKQENGVRPGTYNTHSIIGFEKAFEIAQLSLDENHQKVNKLKVAFIESIKDLNSVFILDDSSTNPYILSIAFKDIKAEVIVRMLSDQGVYVSTGSSCSSGTKNSNRVVKNIKKFPNEYKEGNIRISFSAFNTLEEVEKASIILKKIIKRLEKIFNKGN